MPRQQSTADQIQDESEALFLEQAKAYFRDLRQAAQNAPYGKIIANADAFAVQHGRERERLRKGGGRVFRIQPQRGLTE